MGKATPIYNLLAQIANEEGLTGAQQSAMRATMSVESGGRPDAIGDGGTSFGLFQHHIGGAGGTTEAQARRYLDPAVSIRERARKFKRLNIRGGTGAAALQGPADPRGYASKVDAALRGRGGLLNSPVQSSASFGGGPLGNPSVDRASQARRSWLSNYLFSGDPVLKSLFDTSIGPDPATISPPPSGGEGRKSSTGSPAKGGIPGKRKGEADWQYIQRIGQSKFGLRNDAGDSQTTGGRHSAGSEHYEGRAVDFGTAKNSEKALRAWERWARANGFDVLNEGDHRHVSTGGGGI